MGCKKRGGQGSQGYYNWLSLLAAALVFRLPLPLPTTSLPIPTPGSLRAHRRRQRRRRRRRRSGHMPSSILNLKFKVRSTRHAYSQACSPLRSDLFSRMHRATSLSSPSPTSATATPSQRPGRCVYRFVSLIDACLTRGHPTHRSAQRSPATSNRDSGSRT